MQLPSWLGSVIKYHESCLYKSRYPGDTKAKLHIRRKLALERKAMRIKIRIPNPEDVKSGAKWGDSGEKEPQKNTANVIITYPKASVTFADWKTI